MSYTFDYIVAELKCPICGNVSKADESTNMQTKICKNSEMRAYAVGDYMDVDAGNIVESGYMEVMKPVEENTFKLIDSWECPSCETAYNWALIELIQGQIAGINQVDLSVEQIEAVNYISEDCGYLGWTVHEGSVLFSEE